MSDIDPPVPARAAKPPAIRRRSSVAYDPARDIFTEIPETISEHAVVEDEPASTQPGSSHQASNSVAMSSPDGSRKRDLPSEERAATQDEPASKRQKPSESTSDGTSSNTNPLSKLPRIPKKPRADDADLPPKPSRVPPSAPRPTDSRPAVNEDGERRRDPTQYRQPRRRRSRSPTRGTAQAFRRRSPPRVHRRDPSRSPSPIRDSPPRDSRPQQRPGGGRGRGRNLLAEQQRLEAAHDAAQGHNSNRAIQGVVSQWYNAVPEYVKERGRDWRKNESQIKGLRSFNNWVKSCLIQKFSPQEKRVEQEEELGWGETAKEPEEMKPLLVLDIGCGKGGDLGKWEKAPQQVGLYVGLDPAETSVDQARDRWKSSARGRRPRFDAVFGVKDCFGEWLGDVPIVQEVGIDPQPGAVNRWKQGGFDVVTMMFTIHYSFESQEKVEMMLRNVAGALKKGGRLIGVCPNSDVLGSKVKRWYDEHPEEKAKVDAATAASNGASTPQQNGNHTPAQASAPAPTSDPAPIPTISELDTGPNWSNPIYSVRFPPQPPVPTPGTFRPPFGWKYTYWMVEAVDVPEFVVPWEAFRSIAENYGLEQRYRKGFLDIWHHETDPKMCAGGDVDAARDLKQLGVRMGVVRSPHDGGGLLMSEEEKEAVSFYHGFCFVKT